MAGMVSGVAGVLLMVAGSVTGSTRLDLDLLEVELPGPPIEVFTSDLDRDGIGDLLILVAYTTWDQITISEEIEDDEVEGLIEMMTIVPALADRRELFFLRGSADGGFEPVSEGFEVPRDVYTLVRGPSSAPVLALDGQGLSAVRLVGIGGTASPVDAAEDAATLSIEFQRLLSEPSILVGGGSLLPGLPLTADVDGDQELDLLYPLEDRFEVYLGKSPGFADADQPLEPTQAIYLPARDELQLGSRQMHYPLPRTEDLNGDGFPELILTHPARRVGDPWISTNSGGKFGPLRRPLKDRKKQAELFGGMVFLGDVDGDGQAEFVREQIVEDQDAGFRDEMRAAKVPIFDYEIFATDSNFDLKESPRKFSSTGYAFGADSDADFPLPGGFQDLNGDGRQDLVTITLDFSMMQMVRIMVTQSISIGLDFHVRCQQADGTFSQVQGLDLSGKFKVRLNDLRIGQLSQFAGDFDGDGRADFVQIGRGKSVSIHRGGENCQYPSKPDLSFDLAAEPKNLSLVKVGDYDGDDLADLLIVHPRKGRRRANATGGDASTLPVMLEMHLSRKGSVDR